MMTNPMNGNPFATRADVQRAVQDLTTPLLAGFSPGRARVELGTSAAHFHTAAAHLEGLSRPFWGLAPLLAGGGTFDGIDLFVEGVNNGADPDHPEYWGPVADRDQRMVESAALGYALALAPETFWDGLTGRGRDCLRDWLLHSLQQTPAPNNWNFFHVLVSLGLTRVGVDHDLSIIKGNLDRLETWDMGNGWYRDGDQRQADHYIPFAMHFYGLIYAQYGPEADAARRERFRERARLFAPQIAHWYGADGSALPYGRSLTYRFAHGGIWGALALAGEEALPWGEIRGHWARNLRWWSDKPITDRTGVMSIGYGYAQLSMAERYNSPGSPYWAFKAFAPLALPETHPFWTAEETPAQERDGVVSLPEPGMVKYEDKGDVTVLSGGQQSPTFGRTAEKYNKFAYSTRYGFSAEPEGRCFANGTFDNMLAFSENGELAALRSRESMARIGDDWLFSAWSPMPEVEVETWLIARAPWHLRIHRIVTGREVETVEGGFAIRRYDPTPARNPEPAPIGPMAGIATQSDMSCIVDGTAPFENPVSRTPRIITPEPNSNVIWPQSWVPQLTGTLTPGTWSLAAWVRAGRDMALPDGAPEGLPTAADLVAMREGGQVIKVWDL
ncbi:DUF2264 domain-containing protein [Oceaniglobus trochenteri]|uniref:DUF2264 domain-containing protein n=1 Tax=Oceaniglobus trochenteri TaxID=2763260 RepID=UPI001CFF7607|nr:DUF2264 domain-containing protein [Oceaniglobus trochenteri]